MAEKKKCLATVKSQSELAPGIYSLWLAFPEEYNVAAMAKPGQFLSLYSDDGSRLLPRPISICEIDAAKRMIRLVYRVAGAGTLEFSGKQEGCLLYTSLSEDMHDAQWITSAEFDDLINNKRMLADLQQADVY